ncbi:MAG: ATP-binding protein [Rhodoferax sp.]|nr:ATP-binding protein [Rhodoferax sp.]MCF8211212.1 ATP-binding protein [Rhodoferax sp.]
MNRKKLPIGIQTFAKIREDDFYYVDKTPFALQLIDKGSQYFLSRPRRFGKSLFLDTLKELFEGNKALFHGLYAEKHWDWSLKFPVLHFSFGGGVLGSAADLQASLHEQLTFHEQVHGLPANFPDARSRFKTLIRTLAEQAGQRVVILIDEYDKPILDRIEEPQIAREMREGLKDFYSVIKEGDAHVRFAFLTGVSKFSKVSLFSGLNHLTDITIDARYSSLCGYTDADVDTVFAPEIEGMDRDEIRRWYNGYNWTGTAVYNPFDLLLLFDKRQFAPYWFETGTPTFLVKLLSRQGFFTPDLAKLQSGEALLSTFDVDHIAPEALLFQTGYLTIHKLSQPLLGQWVYELGYPNLEVESSLNVSLLAGLGANERVSFSNRLKLIELLRANDFCGLQTLFSAFFASIPHDWYRNNPIANYEGYWASVFYSHFAALGLDIQLEDTTNQGCIDMAVRFSGQVYLFEFKVVEHEPQGRALQQIKDRGYAEKYRADGQPIHLIGVEFSKEKRTVVGFAVETIPSLDAASVTHSHGGALGP